MDQKRLPERSKCASKFMCDLRCLVTSNLNGFGLQHGPNMGPIIAQKPTWPPKGHPQIAQKSTWAPKRRQEASKDPFLGPTCAHVAPFWGATWSKKAIKHRLGRARAARKLQGKHFGPKLGPVCTQAQSTRGPRPASARKYYSKSQVKRAVEPTPRKNQQTPWLSGRLWGR